VAHRLVPPVDVSRPVAARIPHLAVHRLAHGQADAEAGLVDRVRHAVRVGVDRPVGQQVHRQLVERLLGVDTPDDLPQGRPGLDRRRQAGIIDVPQLDHLTRLRREPGPVLPAVQRIESEVGEEANALVEVRDAVNDPLHAHDRHCQRSPQLLRRACSLEA